MTFAAINTVAAGDAHDDRAAETELALATEGFDRLEATIVQMYESALMFQRARNTAQARACFGAIVRDEGAIANIHRSSRLKKVIFLSWKNLATIMEDSGDGRGAIGAVLKCVEMDTTDATLWYTLGRLAAHEREDALARRAFEACLEIDPSHSLAAAKLTALAYAIGDNGAVVALCKKRLALSATHAALASQLAALAARAEPGTAVGAPEGVATKALVHARNARLRSTNEHGGDESPPISVVVAGNSLQALARALAEALRTSLEIDDDEPSVARIRLLHRPDQPAPTASSLQCAHSAAGEDESSHGTPSSTAGRVGEHQPGALCPLQCPAGTAAEQCSGSSDKAAKLPAMQKRGESPPKPRGNAEKQRVRVRNLRGARKPLGQKTAKQGRLASAKERSSGGEQPTVLDMMRRSAEHATRKVSKSASSSKQETEKPKTQTVNADETAAAPQSSEASTAGAARRALEPADFEPSGFRDVLPLAKARTHPPTDDLQHVLVNLRARYGIWSPRSKRTEATILLEHATAVLAQDQDALRAVAREAGGACASILDPGAKHGDAEIPDLPSHSTIAFASAENLKAALERRKLFEHQEAAFTAQLVQLVQQNSGAADASARVLCAIATHLEKGSWTLSLPSVTALLDLCSMLHTCAPSGTIASVLAQHSLSMHCLFVVYEACADAIAATAASLDRSKGASTDRAPKEIATACQAIAKAAASLSATASASPAHRLAPPAHSPALVSRPAVRAAVIASKCASASGDASAAQRSLRAAAVALRPANQPAGAVPDRHSGERSCVTLPHCALGGQLTADACDEAALDLDTAVRADAVRSSAFRADSDEDCEDIARALQLLDTACDGADRSASADHQVDAVQSARRAAVLAAADTAKADLLRRVAAWAVRAGRGKAGFVAATLALALEDPWWASQPRYSAAAGAPDAAPETPVALTGSDTHAVKKRRALTDSKEAAAESATKDTKRQKTAGVAFERAGSNAAAPEADSHPTDGCESTSGAVLDNPDANPKEGKPAEKAGQQRSGASVAPVPWREVHDSLRTLMDAARDCPARSPDVQAAAQLAVHVIGVRARVISRVRVSHKKSARCVPILGEALWTVAELLPPSSPLLVHAAWIFDLFLACTRAMPIMAGLCSPLERVRVRMLMTLVRRGAVKRSDLSAVVRASYGIPLPKRLFRRGSAGDSDSDGGEESSGEGAHESDGAVRGIPQVEGAECPNDRASKACIGDDQDDDFVDPQKNGTGGSNTSAAKATSKKGANRTVARGKEHGAAAVPETRSSRPGSGRRTRIVMPYVVLVTDADGNQYELLSLRVPPAARKQSEATAGAAPSGLLASEVDLSSPRAGCAAGCRADEAGTQWRVLAALLRRRLSTTVSPSAAMNVLRALVAPLEMLLRNVDSDEADKTDPVPGSKRPAACASPVEQVRGEIMASLAAAAQDASLSPRERIEGAAQAVRRISNGDAAQEVRKRLRKAVGWRAANRAVNGLWLEYARWLRAVGASGIRPGLPSAAEAAALHVALQPHDVRALHVLGASEYSDAAALVRDHKWHSLPTGADLVRSSAVSRSAVDHGPVHTPLAPVPTSPSIDKKPTAAKPRGSPFRGISPAPRSREARSSSDRPDAERALSASTAAASGTRKRRDGAAALAGAVSATKRHLLGSLGALAAAAHLSGGSSRRIALDLGNTGHLWNALLPPADRASCTVLPVVLNVLETAYPRLRGESVRRSRATPSSRRRAAGDRAKNARESPADSTPVVTATESGANVLPPSPSQAVASHCSDSESSGGDTAASDDPSTSYESSLSSASCTPFPGEIASRSASEPAPDQRRVPWDLALLYARLCVVARRWTDALSAVALAHTQEVREETEYQVYNVALKAALADDAPDLAVLEAHIRAATLRSPKRRKRAADRLEDTGAAALAAWDPDLAVLTPMRRARLVQRCLDGLRTCRETYTWQSHRCVYRCAALALNLEDSSSALSLVLTLFKTNPQRAEDPIAFRFWNTTAQSGDDCMEHFIAPRKYVCYKSKYLNLLIQSARACKDAHILAQVAVKLRRERDPLMAARRTDCLLALVEVFSVEIRSDVVTAGGEMCKTLITLGRDGVPLRHVESHAEDVLADIATRAPRLQAQVAEARRALAGHLANAAGTPRSSAQTHALPRRVRLRLSALTPEGENTRP